MTKDEIIALNKEMIGNVTPQGESNIDEKRYHNLEKLCGVCDSLLMDIAKAADTHGPEWSKERARRRARKELKDWRLWIEAMEMEWEENEC